MIDNQFEIIYFFFADMKNDKRTHMRTHTNNKSDSSTKKLNFFAIYFIGVFIWSSITNIVLKVSPSYWPRLQCMLWYDEIIVCFCISGCACVYDVWGALWITANSDWQFSRMEIFFVPSMVIYYYMFLR